MFSSLLGKLNVLSHWCTRILGHTVLCSSHLPREPDKRMWHYISGTTRRKYGRQIRDLTGEPVWSVCRWCKTVPSLSVPFVNGQVWRPAMRRTHRRNRFLPAGGDASTGQMSGHSQGSQSRGSSLGHEDEADTCDRSSLLWRPQGFLESQLLLWRRPRIDGLSSREEPHFDISIIQHMMHRYIYPHIYERATPGAGPWPPSLLPRSPRILTTVIMTKGVSPCQVRQVMSLFHPRLRSSTVV
jgi:hypothetical protein